MNQTCIFIEPNNPVLVCPSLPLCTHVVGALSLLASAAPGNKEVGQSRKTGLCQQRKRSHHTRVHLSKCETQLHTLLMLV